jgi:hypothetical protein
MQFRAPPPPQVSGLRPTQRPRSSDRDYPLHTAGDGCLWHVDGTAAKNDQAAHQVATAPSSPTGVRPVLGDHRLVGKSPKGSRQPGGELDRSLGCFAGPGRDRGREMTCGSCMSSVTARACRGPAAPDAVQAQHRPEPCASRARVVPRTAHLRGSCPACCQRVRR